MKYQKTMLAIALALAAPLAMAQQPTSADHAQHKADQAQTMEHPDAWVLAKVKTQFAASDTVDATDINVDVMNGVVTLRGTVNGAAERKEAERIAKTTEGVKSVNATGLMTTKAGAGNAREMEESPRR